MFRSGLKPTFSQKEMHLESQIADFASELSGNSPFRRCQYKYYIKKNKDIFSSREFHAPASFPDHHTVAPSFRSGAAQTSNSQEGSLSWNLTALIISLLCPVHLIWFSSWPLSLFLIFYFPVRLLVTTGQRPSVSSVTLYLQHLEWYVVGILKYLLNE